MIVKSKQNIEQLYYFLNDPSGINEDCTQFVIQLIKNENIHYNENDKYQYSRVNNLSPVGFELNVTTSHNVTISDSERIFYHVHTFFVNYLYSKDLDNYYHISYLYNL